jgi:alanine racemase
LEASLQETEMEPRESYPTWVETDLNVIESNIRLITHLTQSDVMAVVKANGYGHGAIHVAKSALRGGATWCAVSQVEEAIKLRQSGLNCPLLVLGFTPRARLSEVIDQDISLTFWSDEHIQETMKHAQAIGRNAKVHMRVDTGMGLLGAQPDAVEQIMRRAHGLEGVLLEGMFTNFARADEPEIDTTSKQLKTFLDLLRHLEAVGLRPPIVHAANSAATLVNPETHLDLVRIGSAMYGFHSSAECRLPEGFYPALAWKTQLSQTKALPPGRGLSYGHVYITQRNEHIGTLPVGYADGLRSIDGNKVLIRGREVPIVGRVSMDQCLVQLDNVPEAEVGDEVVLIGRQGEMQISAEEVARRWNAINYEVTCGIGSRVPRLYGEGRSPSPRA